nr:DHH family phosphoesterase [Candidatus Omnitrophota bacterium]
MRKTWRIKDHNPSIRNNLAAALKVSPITAQLLINRGIDDIKSASDFLDCSISSCHDPFLFKDMDKAVSRIKDAISRREKILVYGDYDVDGMTGVAVLSSAFKSLGADIHTYIPNRLEEGYGLNMGAIKRAHSSGISLIVTVDCGISSVKEIEYAKTLNIDVVVTDHHEIPGSQVPKAHAVVNALQADCKYPFKHLAGVGVAYKLVSALFEGTPFSPQEYLDLVSLGTVADVVPMVGENRIIAKHGLELLGRSKRAGLRALMEVTGLEGKDI